jgi:glutathione S-transferase
MKLYELVIDDGGSISPYVWRIKYALARKGIDYQSVPLGFREIPAILDGQFRTVPVFEDGSGPVVDSWAIADHLDRAYPTRPLFSTPAERALTQAFDHHFLSMAARAMFGLCVKDIHDRARPEDQAYFRESREKRLGGLTLEAYAAERDGRIPALRDALAPLRLSLAGSPWVCGDEPGYADYIALGCLIWFAAVSTVAPLAADDPVIPWFERGLDLYGGIGRSLSLAPFAA